MKHLLLALAIGLTAIGCCERDPDKNINPNVLPPATQVGANTGGCLVNGEVWVASTKGYSSPYEDDTTYRLENENGFRLGIVLKYIKNDEDFILIGLNQDEPLKLNHEYILNGQEGFGNGLVIFKDAYYSTSNECIGKLTITHIDRKKQFISGTFEMEVIQVKPYDGNKKIKITKGRFDKKYIS